VPGAVEQLGAVVVEDRRAARRGGADASQEAGQRLEGVDAGKGRLDQRIKCNASVGDQPSLAVEHGFGYLRNSIGLIAIDNLLSSLLPLVSTDGVTKAI